MREPEKKKVIQVPGRNEVVLNARRCVPRVSRSMTKDGPGACFVNGVSQGEKSVWGRVGTPTGTFCEHPWRQEMHPFPISVSNPLPRGWHGRASGLRTDPGLGGSRRHHVGSPHTCRHCYFGLYVRWAARVVLIGRWSQGDVGAKLTRIYVECGMAACERLGWYGTYYGLGHIRSRPQLT